MKPTLKPPESKRLKLEHEKVLSNFAFNFNLRRYTQPVRAGQILHARGGVREGRAVQVEPMKPMFKAP